jgi:hypothetical protein
MDEPKISPNRGNAGKGRPKGAINKNNAAIKDMVVQALDKAGGVDYLVTQARETPTAFIGLLGKVLPMQVVGSGDDGSHKITVSWEK